MSSYNAVRSITTWDVYQYFEEDIKGTITISKLADFVILNKNPIKFDPKTINTIQVLETIKEGKLIYKK